jgi:thymidylate kinase
MPKFDALHPQSLTMESMWVCSWFQRLLKKVEEGDESNQVLIADRSPFSAVFYTHNGQGQLLKELIKAQIKELKELGIEIYTVHMKVDETVLWDRISNRLKDEPERITYKEDSKEWMYEVKAFYDSFEWDFTVDNSKDSTTALTELMFQLINQVGKQSPKFRDLVNKKKYFCGSPIQFSMDNLIDGGESNKSLLRC